MQILFISAEKERQSFGPPEMLAAHGIELTQVSPHDLQGALSSPCMIGRHFDAVIVDPDALTGVEWLLNLLSTTGRAALLLSLARNDSRQNEVVLRRLGVDKVLVSDQLDAVGLTAEITRLRQLHAQQTPAATVADHAPDALIGVDGNGIIRFFNAAAERMFGRATDMTVGQPLSLLLPPRFRAGHGPMMAAFRDNPDADTHMAWRRGVFALHADGHEIPIEVSLSRLETADGRLMLAAIRDISNRLNQEAEYYRLATHDSLTGLFNRASLWDILRRDMARTRRNAQDIAVLLLDVDRFKQVNDTLGHLAGDEVLSAVATRIDDAMRAGDACCRFGGEEFVAILPDTPADAAMVVAERLRALIADTPIMTRGGTVQCTVSIGVATLSTIAAKDAEALLHAADMAMLEAKRAGRNRVHQHEMESV